jgi:hypothetical protein
MKTAVVYYTLSGNCALGHATVTDTISRLRLIKKIRINFFQRFSGN